MNNNTTQNKNENTHNATSPTALPAEESCLKNFPEKVDGNRNFYLALLGIFIAVFGGVPGALGIIDYYNKSSIRIMYDEKQSFPCFIANSPRQDINDKFTVLLYGITIVGKGSQKFVVYDVNISIKKIIFGIKVSFSSLYSE